MQLARWTEADVAALHEMGLKALDQLRAAMAECGLRFRLANSDGPS